MNTKLSAVKAKLFPAKMESQNDIPLKDMDIFDHIEKIVEISIKNGIEKCLTKGKCHLDYVTGKLRINRIQAILFSHFMERSDKNQIRISEIAESIKCSKVRIIKYINECEELERKKLIRCCRDGDGIRYRIPRAVNDSLRKNNEYIPEKNENLSIFHFFNVIEEIFDERGNNELSYDTMKLELLDLIGRNKHLEFCKKIMRYNFRNGNLVLLLCFCHLFGNNNDDNIGPNDLEFLYDQKFIFSDIKQLLSEGFHPLMEAKLIEHNNTNGFIESDSWKLSDHAKKELMAEFKENKNYRKNMILFDTIKEKKMFYNNRETEEIKKLVSLLQEENFQKIQDRLNGKGMRKGFACLFSGPPGTGKTETAYQIARETKRNIMMVDISETKSCWYGESEKKIKQIFDIYKSAAEKSAITPILLFNEADAVIGSRRDIGKTNPGIDQTENRIQNIILQEIENLSGILIATTNLVQNKDKAFERRFLYKVTFDKPALESRIGIWKSLIPDITEETARELSCRFELSGGQIENISRKTEVDYIINGNGLSMETLAEYSKAETLNDPNAGKTIGF